MPKYRIPIHGALLIEAESERLAQMFAGMWTVSVRQMTQGVDIQECHGILGAMVVPDDLAVADVSTSYGTKREELEKQYSGFPQKLAERCTNYFVGEQMWFEQFEKESNA